MTDWYSRAMRRPSTSLTTEEVEKTAEWLNRINNEAYHRVAAMLRALVQDRDAGWKAAHAREEQVVRLDKRCELLQQTIDDATKALDLRVAERDAAWNEAIEAAANVPHGSQHYPRETANAIRALKRFVPNPEADGDDIPEEMNPPGDA